MSFALLAHGDTGDVVDQFADITCRAPGDYSPWAGRLSGRDSPTSIAAIASSISLPMLGCLALA